MRTIKLLTIGIPLLFFSTSSIALEDLTEELPVQKAISQNTPLADRSIQNVIKMAHAGHPDAQMRLGYAYAMGQGVKKDMKKSFEWSLKAARQGNMKAQYNVGLDYIQRWGPEKDPEKAKYWFKKSAAQGYQPAKEALLNFNIDKIPNAATTFAEKLKRDAEAGNEKAAFEVAQIYQFGKGVPRDRHLGIKWLEKAANLGHAEAQYLMSGVVLEKNSNQQRFKWTKMAAENGHAIAQKNLAIFYGTSDDTPFDLQESYAWMRVAQANGLTFPEQDVQNIERSVSLFQKAADKLADEYIQKYIGSRPSSF